MKKKKLIFIVGRTGSGKDYVADMLCENFNLSKIKSYTTRPRRSEKENTHIFIDQNHRMKFQYEDMVAYTKIGDYEYFTTKNQLNDHDIYVIDPNGVIFFKETGLSKYFEILLIYINTSLTTRQQRYLNRLNNSVTGLQSFYERDRKESEEFDHFEKLLSDRNKPMSIYDIDYGDTIKQTYIYNNDDGLKTKELFEIIESFMK